MKATLVKNDEFQTIGFEVIASAKTLFSWGISPASPIYWTKTVNADDWMTEIFELVRTQAKLAEVKNFVSDFFDVAKANKLVKSGQSVNFEDNQKLIESLMNKIENIIKSIS